MFESLQVDLRNLITLERDIEAQQTGVDQLRAESAELRETVEKAKIEFKSQGHRVELLANHIAKAEERLHQLRTNITQHRDRAEKKIESLKTE
jgi:predicted  nucleic acid-binding Zn-ribbon protein